MENNINTDNNTKKHSIAMREEDIDCFFYNPSTLNENIGVDIEFEEDVPNCTGIKVRDDIKLANHSEPEVVKYFVNLSQSNYSIDTNFYPLGSCTMKYNPRINEKVSRLISFTESHPLQPTCSVQGNLEIIYTLQEWLKKLSGLDDVCLLPAAGAHGEYTGIRIIKSYFE
mgnify:CR=1 FL=1